MALQMAQPPAGVAEQSPAAQQQVDDEEGDDIIEVEKLQEVGLNAADLKKLKESGFHTVTSLKG